MLIRSESNDIFKKSKLLVETLQSEIFSFSSFLSLVPLIPCKVVVWVLVETLQSEIFSFSSFLSSTNNSIQGCCVGFIAGSLDY